MLPKERHKNIHQSPLRRICCKSEKKSLNPTGRNAQRGGVTRRHAGFKCSNSAGAHNSWPPAVTDEWGPCNGRSVATSTSGTLLLHWIEVLIRTILHQSADKSWTPGATPRPKKRTSIKEITACESAWKKSLCRAGRAEDARLLSLTGHPGGTLAG